MTFFQLSHLHRLPILTLAWVLGAALRIMAADAPVPPAESSRHAEFRAALEADRMALQTRQGATEAELHALEARRDALASKLVDLELQRLAMAQRVDASEHAVATAVAAAEPLRDASTKAAASASALAAKIDVALGDTPVGDALRQAADHARQGLTGAPGPTGSLPHIQRLIEVGDQLHALATSTSISLQTVYLADGEPLQADVLAVSLARFAYVSADGGAAIALGSPEDASGYRWLAALPARQHASVTAAVAALQDGQSATLPMDVTGVLRIESWDRASAVSIRQRLEQGGKLMWPLAFVAVLALVLLLERFVVFLRARSPQPALEAAMTAADAGDAAGSRAALAPHADRLAASLMLAALDAYPLGQNAMEDHIETRMLAESPRLRRRLSGIAVLAAIAPLLGLLGTVTGIIQTFGVIESTGRTDPSLMAGGISQALITTAAGLIIAIPILLLHRMIVGLMDGLMADAEARTAVLLNSLSREVPRESAD